MKNIATALLLSLLLSAPVLAHQEHAEEYTSNRSLKLGIDGMWALFGAFFAQGEFKVSDNMSLLARVGYVDTRWTINNGINPLSGGAILPGDGFAAGNVSLGARWYWRGGCMEGLFLQDYVQFDAGRTFSGNAALFLGQSLIGPWAFSLSNYIHGGYSWVTDIGLFFDVMVGIRTHAVWGIPNPPTFAGMNSLEARMNVGWTF
jgi:hypothetical protein